MALTGFTVVCYHESGHDDSVWGELIEQYGAKFNLRKVNIQQARDIKEAHFKGKGRCPRFEIYIGGNLVRMFKFQKRDG